MNIREADELPVISSESDEHFTSDTTERRDKDKPEVLVPTSSKTEQQQQRRKPSYSDGSSLIPYAKDAQKAARKKSVAETSAATVDELATSHPAPGTIGRKSTTGLSLQHSRAIQKSIEKSIFGASPRQNLDSSQNEQEQKSLLKRSLFRKTTGVLSGSSTPSALNSAESVTEDIVEVAVPKGAASSYSFDSFEGSSVSDLSSLASSEVSAMSLVEEPDSTRTQDMTRKSHLVYENLLTDFERVFGKFIENSRKTRQDIKETSNAAAQTVAVRKDSELPPTFTPLLLRDIEG
ncbi:unnamed protein product [Gongylonema pulchrum]|uniref:Uncharacterized protein n=1 Tax=Gongylonema pulchrum TaxID=637853 RepID=A0A183CWA4_9BILA|nr:unnamed protein product [Gongylonema pulchrum]